jgi:hypothetical protein
VSLLCFWAKDKNWMRTLVHVNFKGSDRKLQKDSRKFFEKYRFSEKFTLASLPGQKCFFFLNKYSSKKFEGIPKLEKTSFSILDQCVFCCPLYFKIQKTTTTLQRNLFHSFFSGIQMSIPRARTDCHLG